MPDVGVVQRATRMEGNRLLGTKIGEGPSQDAGDTFVVGRSGRGTVESHLSHVFNKLGLSNRAQLAAAVIERRNSPPDP